MSERFQVVNVNPNDTCGGGGCLCGETKQADCGPPYVVWYATDMENPLSPHPVTCLDCLRAAVDEAETEVLAGGEINDAIFVIEEPVDATALLIDPEDEDDIEV